jgi:two-component system, OmpR family, alkaline phosphatase synthesis response regulator PhoP
VSEINPGPRPSPDGSADDLASLAVLVVDDNEQNLELIQAYLEDLGCQIRAARDGLEALKSVEADQPDIILLDVMMPRMSGFQACSRIKANPQTRDIPVIMITALNEVGDVERAVESGADDFLTKPVNKLELLTRVRSLLRVRQLKKQLDRTLEQMRRLGGAGGGGPASA